MRLPGAAWWPLRSGGTKDAKLKPRVKSQPDILARCFLGELAKDGMSCFPQGATESLAEEIPRPIPSLGNEFDRSSDGIIFQTLAVQSVHGPHLQTLVCYFVIGPESNMDSSTMVSTYRQPVWEKLSLCRLTCPSFFPCHESGHDRQAQSTITLSRLPLNSPPLLPFSSIFATVTVPSYRQHHTRTARQFLPHSSNMAVASAVC